MAIIRGGLHGRPSGNVAGVVYGAARTRTGKAVTARELVYPSNPKTAGQLLQRHIFLESLYATRHLGPSVYSDDFNRSIGQLPGFQSMMSIIMNNTDAAEEVQTPPDTPLGNLNFPATFTVVTGAGAAGTFKIDFSTELGLNGTNGDKLCIVMVAKVANVGYERYVANQLECVNRSVGTWVSGFVAWPVVIQVGCYFRGKGAAVGLLSPCNWFEVTNHA